MLTLAGDQIVILPLAEAFIFVWAITSRGSI
ncbi:MAG: hypothetical protein ACI8XV_003089 [Arenicella sp.]